MGVALRVAVVAFLVVIPGGFLMLFAFLLGRRLLRAVRESRERRGSPSLRDVLAAVSVRQVLRDARASL